MCQQINSILARFPKIRQPLPAEYQAIYSSHYQINRQGQSKATSVSQKMEAWMHKKVAADLTGQKTCTLELGAGTLNQLDYETVNGSYDIVEPFQELFKNSLQLPKVRNIYRDIREISLEAQYDRITSVAVFEHLTDLPEVAARTALLVKENGSVRVAIPNEGRWLWKLGYTLTTGIEFKLKYGLNYQVMMQYEHVNTAREIESVLQHFFGKIKYADYGIGKYCSFYRYLECSNPQKETAGAFLDRNQPSSSN